MLAKEPLSHDAQANALVEKVGRRIAAAAERPPAEMWRAPRFRWEFKTIDKNEPNAFCLPGGKVAVYTGLLPITRTEAGLAVVIGHEVAHALARHGAERMSDQMVASVGAAAAAVGPGGDRERPQPRLPAGDDGGGRRRRHRGLHPADVAGAGIGGRPHRAGADGDGRLRPARGDRPCGSACARPMPAASARPSG